MTAAVEPARQNALQHYAERHQRFDALERWFMLQGREIEAAGCHAFALVTLRAYRAELDDPEESRRM